MSAELPVQDAVVAQWEAWRQREISRGRQASIADAIRFCGYLARKRSKLLDRCPPGDAWQHIKDWLIKRGLVAAPPKTPSIR
jgi:hypothetical protein